MLLAHNKLLRMLDGIYVTFSGFYFRLEFVVDAGHELAIVVIVGSG